MSSFRPIQIKFLISPTQPSSQSPEDLLMRRKKRFRPCPISIPTLNLSSMPIWIRLKVKVTHFLMLSIYTTHPLHLPWHRKNELMPKMEEPTLSNSQLRVHIKCKHIQPQSRLARSAPKHIHEAIYHPAHHPICSSKPLKTENNPHRLSPIRFLQNEAISSYTLQTAPSFVIVLLDCDHLSILLVKWWLVQVWVLTCIFWNYPVHFYSDYLRRIDIRVSGYRTVTEQNWKYL